MAGIVVNPEPATVVMTGIEFTIYANRYFDAAEALHGRPRDERFDPIPYHLLCQSLELHLKSFIWLADQLTRNQFKRKYGHDIVKLWHYAKERGIAGYCAATPLRNETIELVGPLYEQRKFAYLDLSMSWKGIPLLRANKHVLPTVRRLCKQLRKSLNEPILQAS